MKAFNEMLKIADIHVDRINLAISTLKPIFPLSRKTVLDFSNNDLLFIELLISRFSKLQDYLGGVIINNFLMHTGDYRDNLTMIDKVHQLEKLEIISDAELWKRMREVRNHIAHEYPDNPELTANYLNQVFDLAPVLLEILDNIKNRL